MRVWGLTNLVAAVDHLRGVHYLPRARLWAHVTGLQRHDAALGEQRRRRSAVGMGESVKSLGLAWCDAVLLFVWRLGLGEGAIEESLPES